MDYNCPSCGVNLLLTEIKPKLLRPSTTQQYPVEIGWYLQCPHCEALLAKNEFNLEMISNIFYFIAFFPTPMIIQAAFMDKLISENFISYTVSFALIFVPVHLIFKFLKKKSPKTSYWKLYKKQA